MSIHATAMVHPDARLGPDVSVGAYAIIGPGVAVGRGTAIESHAVIDQNTRIGEDCHIYSHAVIGSDSQDLKYAGEPTYLEVGDRTVLREYVTLNRGSREGSVTRVGSDCMLMTGVHIAHDCQLGDHVVMANLATLAGHITVGDGVVIGGLAAFHQFLRVGQLAMVGGTAGVMQDVPPYCMVQGAPPATVRALNLVGLARAGVGEKSILALKHAFRLMFRLGMSRDNALAEIDAAVPKTTEVRHFIDWMKAPSERGVCKAEIASRFSVVGGADTSVGGAGVPARQPHTLESKGRDAGTGTGGTAQPKV